MKICQRGLNMVQVENPLGGVRICSWLRDGGNIGSLLDNTMEELYHGDRAEKIHNSFFKGDYSICDSQRCPYIANGILEENLEDVECVPRFPETLFLGFENVCNYKCTCCSAHGYMTQTKGKDWEKNYDIIEERLREVLPYVKNLSANGLGELFMSKRTLKLLSEWEPIYPKEEVCVVLETNGSLFNEKNWKQIENLGKYNLSVSITIMSFQEKTYQYLSGTKLPISNLEHNLEFVKSLRENGVINKLTLATVMQERNFREMPEFVEKCLSYGADRVRIRPIILHGANNKNIEWFADVRNPSHPYYEEYLEVMKHPIFNNQKVFHWSGRGDGETGCHPGIMMDQYLNKILNEQDLSAKIISYINEDENSQGGQPQISIYGVGTIGKMIVKLCQGKLCIASLLDRYAYGCQYEGYDVLSPEEIIKNESDAVLITPLYRTDDIVQYLRGLGYQGRLITLKELFG